MPCDLERGHSVSLGAAASQRRINVSLFFRAAPRVDP
jgi:hypothetical protein